MLKHLPVRTSLINGYGSPSSSWNGREHSVHSYDQQTGNINNERTRKKKKKRKKAEVAMIAESVDEIDSSYIDQHFETCRDLDSEGSDKEIKEIAILNGEYEPSSARNKTDDTLNSALDTEGDTSSEISLTMEPVPMAETMLQQRSNDNHQQLSPSDEESSMSKNSSVVTGSDQAIPSAIVSDENTVSVSSVQHEEDAYGENSTVTCSPADECSEESALKTTELDLKLEEATVENSSQQWCETQQNILEGTSSTNLPEVECQSTSQNPFEAVLEGEIDSASNNEAEEETLTATNNTEAPEYYAALAAFECGTPKQVDSIWEIERSGEANVSYEGEDLNIIPGIHKSFDTRSRSSSGSFNGSGSFQLGSQRSSRHSTMDSNYRTSSFGSGAPGSSWSGGNGPSSRKSSKADVTFGSPGSESQFSEFEMFDELLRLEEDHFSPPEVHVRSVVRSRRMQYVDSCYAFKVRSYMT